MDLTNIINRKKSELSQDDNSTSPKRIITSNEEAQKFQLLERLNKNKKAEKLMDEGMDSVIKDKLTGNGTGLTKTQVKKMFEELLHEYVKNDREGLKSLYVESFNTIASTNMEVLLENVMNSESFINKIADKIVDRIS